MDVQKYEIYVECWYLMSEQSEQLIYLVQHENKFRISEHVYYISDPIAPQE